ncbi:MAG: hypothetical protein EHM61_27920 [Acidobacteria bacterium]|nr:MAG: hypothetical protein EHM61_27920 [Acidobacteriota bacterium]
MRDYLGAVFTVQGVYSAAELSIAVSSAARVDEIAPDGRPQALSPWNQVLPTEAPRRDQNGARGRPVSVTPLAASSGSALPASRAGSATAKATTPDATPAAQSPRGLVKPPSAGPVEASKTVLGPPPGKQEKAP